MTYASFAPALQANETQCTTLAALCRALDAALERPDPARCIRAALATARRQPSLLLDAQREGARECYRRHLLAADPRGRYAVAALVWKPGQRSPVHGHHTWCSYAVIEGTLSETLFSWDPVANRAVKTRSHARQAGAVSFVGAGRGAIHQLGNESASGERAISLHIYGVAGAQIATHVNDLLSA